MFSTHYYEFMSSQMNFAGFIFSKVERQTVNVRHGLCLKLNHTLDPSPWIHNLQMYNLQKTDVDKLKV